MFYHQVLCSQQNPNQVADVGLKRSAFRRIAEEHDVISDISQTALMKHSLTNANSFAETIQNLQRWGQQQDSALWYTINWAMGTKA